MMRNAAAEIRAIFWIACLAVGLFASAPAQAQPPLKQEVPIQHERVVTLKLVQVYVTGKDGKPVPDLFREEFDLFDNGKLATITDFERHALIQPGIAAEKDEASPGPGDLRLNRKFLLFFDFAFNNPRGFEQAKKAALHFLGDEVRPSDEVGIVSYSLYKGLTLHEYFTTDHQKVREVVDGFSQKSVLGRAQNVETEYWNAIQDLTGAANLSVAPTRADGPMNPAVQKLQELSVDRMNYQLHARNFTLRMTDLARTLRLIPGYKHIVMFSSGVASSVFQGAPVAVGLSKLESARKRGDATLYNIESLDAVVWEEKKYDNMVKELAQANCPVFVLNTEDPGQGSSVNKAMSGEYPLKKLSKISGGEYFPKVDDYQRSLARIQDLTGAYYVLGYSIGEKWDGKFHEIKVNVRRKGCEVHAQGGYFNPKPFREYSEFEKTVHFMDVALSDDPQFQTPVGFPMTALAYPTGKDNVLVLLSRIPKDLFGPPGKGRSEVVTLVFDGRKNIVSFKRATVDLSGIAQPASCHYTYSLLPPGDYDCRIVVRNLETGETAVARESVLVPAASGAPFALLPPLLLRTGPDVDYFGVQKKQGAPTDAGALSLTALYPFDAGEFMPSIGDLPAGSSKTHAMVICAFEDIREPALELSFVMKEDLSGVEIPVPHSVVSSRLQAREGERKSRLALLTQLEFSGLRSGSYTLKVTARETTTRVEAESVQKLNIR
ncbi:MAG: VWA domain-containing protein [Candidatus Aminicenantes bacterium]|nr:VWA domain-containing protein [Candidatus Aminicenantes bacterium]